MSNDPHTTKADLKQAWDAMIADFERARDAIDDPALMPPPDDPRNLAEGYRYVMGFVHSAVERAFHEDTAQPFFRHAVHLVNRATIDNSDAIYFMAPIDGRRSYRLKGRVGDHAHWRGERSENGARKAPQYMIFELSDGCIAGDSGSLDELRPGVKAGTGRLDTSALEVEEDGYFEILLAPSRPDGHTGNFIPTHRTSKRPNPEDPEASLERYACYVSGRQLFYDWEHEDASPLVLEPVESEPAPDPNYTPELAVAQLRRAGELVRGQTHFWNIFYTVLLETYGKREGSDGEPFMPRNKFNAPNAAGRETGGGQSSNIYAGGVFDLAPDEALVVETRIAVEPEYIGFSLGNLWGESLDFASRQSSLNGYQARRDSDGAYRWIIAHEDPGFANWVDTTGHPVGFMTARWSYSNKPDESQWPTIAAKKVKIGEVAGHLPADAPEVTPEERAAAIAVRQAHVRRRYRSF